MNFSILSVSYSPGAIIIAIHHQNNQGVTGCRKKQIDLILL